MNKNSLLSGINNSSYSNTVTENQIKNLISSEGYTYDVVDFESNLNKGYIKAVINLSLKDKPLVDSDLSNNPNFTKTIFIYNFKVPHV